MTRVPTGIRRLDEILDGGVMRGTWTLVYGPCGIGKTVMGMQFAWEGLKRGEVVSYDCADRPFPFLRAYFKSFGWDLSPYEEEGKFIPIQSFPRYGNYERDNRIIYYDPSSLEELRDVDMELSRRGVRRLVCGDYAEADWGSPSFRDVLVSINRWSLEWAWREGVTGMVVVAGRPGRPESEEFRGLVEKDMNNVIHLRFNERQREMRIVKMEAIEHPLNWMPFTISREGIELAKRQEGANMRSEEK